MKTAGILIISIFVTVLAVDAQNPGTFQCRDSNRYALAIVEGRIPRTKTINIVVDGSTKNTLALPNDSEVAGFSVDSTTKTANGFEIGVEYGSRYYFHKIFVFGCKRSGFFLVRIKVDSFDKANPEKTSKHRNVFIRPEIPLSRFVLETYLTNP